MKILLIEDDPRAVELLSIFLARHGHQVSVAEDGVTAVMQARRSPPELVITDFHLPAANGGAVRERLLGIGLGSIPIIFVSALRLEKLRALVSPSPQIRFLEKPIRLPDLLQAIDELASGAPS